MSTTPAYRPDIDGLRAVAVAGVLLYHYGATWLPGGFTGVDVFFVISGYLITKILIREIEAGEFSVIGFYARRIRRIIPALLVMLTTTLIAGWFILMPGDYADLGTSTAYAALGLGNLYFHSNTGYFDQASGLQPLLHTWSLGVEEQFYVVWPLALLAGLTLLKSRRLFVAILAVGVLLAFYIAARTTVTDPKAAFYLPHLRAWELSIGALLPFLPAVANRWLSRIMAALGAILIAASVLLITAADAFPGLNAAYACVGAALLIWPKAETLVARALATRPMVAIGLISYSLYLWHWPVLVLFRHYSNGEMPGPAEAFVLGCLSVLLAYCSWRFVEQPFRRAIISPKLYVAAGLASIAAMASAGVWIWRSEGAPQRVTAVLAMSSLDVMWDWNCPYTIKLGGTNTCQFGAPWASADVKAVLWGDSHAEHLAPIIEAATAGKPVSTTLLTPCAGSYGGSVRRLSVAQPEYVQICEAARARALDFLEQNQDVKLVMFSAAWANVATLASHDGSGPDEATPIELMKSGLVETIEAAAAPGRHFVILADIPSSGVDPALCAISTQSGLLRRRCTADIGRELFDLHGSIQQVTEPVLASIATERDDTTMLTPADALCSDVSCIHILNDEPLYRDMGHLRRNLSAKTNRQLADMLGITSIFAPN